MTTVKIGDVEVSHNVKSNRYEEITDTSELLQWGYYLIELKTGFGYLAQFKEHLVSKATFEFDSRYYRREEKEPWKKPYYLVQKNLFIRETDLDKVKIYDLKKKIVIPSLYKLAEEKISPEKMSELRKTYLMPGGKMKSRKYKYKRRKSISSRKSRSKSLRRSVD